jgi:hypothetical protein
MEIADVPTERTIAAEKIDGATSELFTLQDTLAARAAAALRLSLQPAAKPVARPDALVAYESYTRGRGLCG